MGTGAAALEIPHYRGSIEVGNGGNTQLSHAFHNSNKGIVTSDLDTLPTGSVESARSHSLSNNALVSPANTHLLEWAGLLLTPGLGPVRARKLVEHFGSAE